MMAVSDNSVREFFVLWKKYYDSYYGAFGIFLKKDIFPLRDDTIKFFFSFKKEKKIKSFILLANYFSSLLRISQ